MSTDGLCFDYVEDTFSNTFHVTAAQNNEVDALLLLAKTLCLRLAAITPDAGALGNLLPAVAPAQCVAWRDRHQWLWAMRHQWGRRYATEAKMSPSWRPCLRSLLMTSFSSMLHVTHGNCWSVASLLPECGADFTVALALAMSEMPE